METLSLIIPSLIFTGIYSLILLSFANRSLSYASAVESLQEHAEKRPERNHMYRIQGLYKQLRLIKAMQGLGGASFLMCIVSTIAIFVSMKMVAIYTFSIALVLLAVSFIVCLLEIWTSTKAAQANLDRLFISEKRKRQKTAEGKTENTPTKKRRRPSRNIAKQETTEPAGRSKENIVQKSTQGLQD